MRRRRRRWRQRSQRERSARPGPPPASPSLPACPPPARLPAPLRPGGGARVPPGGDPELHRPKLRPPAPVAIPSPAIPILALPPNTGPARAAYRTPLRSPLLTPLKHLSPLCPWEEAAAKCLAGAFLPQAPAPPEPHPVQTPEEPTALGEVCPSPGRSRKAVAFGGHGEQG